ncbi:Patatin domain protein [mine drainage metagenome]|uniref:Patatin domain protein n=1 Tax=mine drainage metagenome TaxID=410659 RepID=T1C5S6_9ZZZZ
MNRRGGDLSLAIRASMSAPAVFAPVDPHGQSLVDGGVSDHVPSMSRASLTTMRCGATTATPCSPVCAD